MRIQAKFAVYVGVVFCLLFMVLLLLSYRQARFDAEREAFSTCKKLVAAVAASRSYVREVLRPVMFELVEKDQFIPEGMSGSFVTHKQFGFFLSDYPDYLMKFASKNPRNPVNKADGMELRIIEEFASDPSLKTWEGITNKGNIDYMTVVKAFRFKKMCMRCHGDPADAPKSMVERYGDINGFRAHEGDVTIYSVGVPIKVTFASVRNRVLYAILPIMGVLIILFYIINRFFRKTVSVPVNNLTKGVHRITHGDYSKHVHLEGTKEFQDLAFAFNKLVDELSGSKMKQVTAEKKYEDLYNNAPDMFVSVDAKTGKITTCNNTLLRQLGYSRDEVIDSPILDMYHPDSISGAQVSFQQFIETGEVHNAELVLECKDGSKLDVSLNVSALRDEEGNILQSRSVWRDITDRKQAEEKIKQQQFYLIKAQELGQIGTWELDLRKNELFWTDENCRIFGVPAGSVVNYEIFIEKIHPDDREYVGRQWKAALDRKPYDIEHRLVVDGTIKWVREKADVEFDEEGAAVKAIGFTQDITERKMAEEELEKHREHLEELVRERTAELEEKADKTEESRKALTYLVEDVNKAREDLERANRDIGAVNRELQDFAYIVSHDLKAPLRAVSQLAYWISHDYAEVLDENGKEHLNLLSGRVKRMDALINGILQYSRLGRAKEKLDKIDLDRTLSSVIEALAPRENIRITIEDELPEIVGNRTHMEQVFQNLIGNAIKFMDKPEGLITIGCRDEGSRWEFRITDNGPGIDEKYHERIFKIFQTLVPRDEHESTGIGLTLVKKTIEQYNGKVWVESEVGKGSSFVFTLPKK